MEQQSNDSFQSLVTFHLCLMVGFLPYSINIMILQSNISLKKPYSFYTSLNTGRSRTFGNSWNLCNLNFIDYHQEKLGQESHLR